jgi:uncharacterized repeat protein (TIGR01451 family)
MEDQNERSERIHKALLDRRPRGPRFAILILIIFAILTLVLAFSIAFLFVRNPSMTLSVEASVDKADPGDIITYTLSYENLGSGDAKSVTISDSLPANVTYVGSYPEYDIVTGSNYTWYMGAVPGGTNGTITITVTINTGVENGTVLTNFAILEYNDDDGNPFRQISDNAKTLI